MSAIHTKFTLPDPMLIGKLDYNEPNKTYTFDVPAIVPQGVRKVYIMSAIRSGSEENSWVNIKIWTINPLTSIFNYHHKRFYRYPQNAISYDSETFSMPLYNDRKIFAFTDHCQPSICHMTELFVVGWKI